MATRNTGLLVLVRGPIGPGGARANRGARPGAWRSALPVVGGFVLLFGLAFAAGMPRHDTAQLRRLPEDARTALYQRTLLEVTSVCSTPVAAEGGVLRDHCLAQARFVRTFPECDQDCQRAARAVMPHVHR